MTGEEVPHKRGIATARLVECSCGASIPVDLKQAGKVKCHACGEVVRLRRQRAGKRRR